MLKILGEKMWDFIDKRKVIIFLIIITLMTLYIRIIPIEKTSGDIEFYLRPWMERIQSNGGFLALNDEIGDYNIPYLVILTVLSYLPVNPVISIKVVSIIFDYVCAIACAVFAKKLLKDDKNRTLMSVLIYAVVLLLPVTILNSAYWGQCDTMYAAFVIIALVFLIDEKYIRAFIFLGIAFAFKLQSILILPVFVFAYMQKRKFPLYHFFIIPIMNIILCTPAFIAGRPFVSIMKIYFYQVNEYSQHLSIYQPCMYGLFLNDDRDVIMAPDNYIREIGFVVTIAVLGIMAFIILCQKRKMDGKEILSLSLWSIMICSFFLPNMHERYMILANILSVVYYAVNKEKLYLPLTLNLISFCGYSAYLFSQNPFPFQYLSLAYLVVIVLFTKSLLGQDDTTMDIMQD